MRHVKRLTRCRTHSNHGDDVYGITMVTMGIMIKAVNGNYVMIHMMSVMMMMVMMI